MAGLKQPSASRADPSSLSRQTGSQGEKPKKAVALATYKRQKQPLVVTDAQIGEAARPLSYLPPSHNPMSTKNTAAEATALSPQGATAPTGNFFGKKRQTQYALPGAPG
jgi:hypothetical protein